MLTLRVRMPIVADLCYPRNFITKIIKWVGVGWGFRPEGALGMGWRRLRLAPAPSLFALYLGRCCRY